jgi:protein SCO1/2
MASEKKKAYVKMAGRDGLESDWHFLVGAHDQIRRLADSVGYKYTEDLKKERFAHPAGIMLLTPQGKLSRYFFGVRYNQKDVRLGLVEASENKIGSLVDRFVLTTCLFQYDPTTGKYGLVVFRLLQIGGLITILTLGTFMYFSFRREKRITAAVNHAKPAAT